MVSSLRTAMLAATLALGGLGVWGAAPARAQGFGIGGFGGRGFSLSINTGVSPYYSYGGLYGAPGYGGSYGYGVSSYGYGWGSAWTPTYQYYGNGGHDASPHWHVTRGPYGAFSWYGNGAHDFQPHEHTRSAYGGYRGYSVGPYGVTESFYPSTPYTYMPW